MGNRASKCKRVIVTVVIAAALTIAGLARTIEAVIRPMLGMEPGGNESWANLIVAPLGIASPWAIAWLAHSRWLRRESASSDPLRRRHVSRLESHGLAAMALAFGAVALGWLLGLAIDTVFGGLRTSNPDGFTWTAEFATWHPNGCRWDGRLGVAVVECPEPTSARPGG